MRPKRKRPRVRWHSSAGFTLVELLVALLLFSLLSVALFGSIRAGTAAWSRATSQADESDHGIIVQDLLRHLIENTYPLYLSDNGKSGHVDFVGSDSSLSFLSVAPMALGNGGRSRINLAVERHDNRVDLLLESKPELAIVNDEVEKARKPLLTGASAVTFSYFGKTPADRSAAWHDDWAKRTELPRLIRIEAHFQANDGRDWPDLIVAPRIVADVGCVLDQITTRCQGR
jgi:general secretion pathway protein J